MPLQPHSTHHIPKSLASNSTQSRKGSKDKIHKEQLLSPSLALRSICQGTNAETERWGGAEKTKLAYLSDAILRFQTQKQSGCDQKVLNYFYSSLRLPVSPSLRYCLVMYPSVQLMIYGF